MKFLLIAASLLVVLSAGAQTTQTVTETSVLYAGPLGLDCVNNSFARFEQILKPAINRIPGFNINDFSHDPQVTFENTCHHTSCHTVQDCRVWLKSEGPRYQFRSTHFWKQTRNDDEYLCQNWIKAFATPGKVIISTSTSTDATGCYAEVVEIIRK